MTQPATGRPSEGAPTPNAGWERERPLSVVADWTFEFIGLLSPDGTLLDANRSALAFVGAELGDVVGRKFWETPWWNDVPRREWLERAVAEAAAGARVRAEVEHVAPDGRHIYVDFSLTPRCDESGRVHALLAEGHDITERRRVDEQRRALLAETLAAERRAEFLAGAAEVLASLLDTDATFRRLAELIVPAIATFCIVDVVDERGSIRRLQVVHERPEMHDAAARLARYPHDPRHALTGDAVAGRRARLVAHVDDARLAAIAEDAEHLEALRALEPASYIVAPLVARGRALGALALCRDATRAPYDESDLAMAEDLAHRAALALDNARLYEQAQRSTLARDEMLGLVSHDLRNPLNAISMCVDVLIERATSLPARDQELLCTIRDSAELSHRLIQDLLDVSAIEAGRLSLERRKVDPVLVAVQAAELFAAPAAAESIALSLDVPESLPPVHADPERLLQALANLIGNAVKFTPAGGSVAIHAAAPTGEGRVILTIADTGPGIPPEDRPFIFDRYWHARRTAKGGTGLGLAIVKGIVAAHGGHVWVEPGESEGSRFSISLPTLQAP